MKKRLVIVMMLICITLISGACSSSKKGNAPAVLDKESVSIERGYYAESTTQEELETTLSDEEIQSIGVSQAQSIQESINAFVESMMDSHNTEVVETTPQEEETSPIIAFPELEEGVYYYLGSPEYYVGEYLEVTAEGITVHYADGMYSFDKDNTLVEIDRNGNYILDNGFRKATIDYNTYSADFIFTDESSGYYFDYINISGIRQYVLNNMPCEGYESLDNGEPWGVMPYDEQISAILLEGFTEDYRIQYLDNVICNGSNASIYSAKCYNSYGDVIKTSDCYVFEDETAAAEYAEYYNTYYDAQYQVMGALCYKSNIDFVKDYFTADTKREDFAYGVYGEHCTMNDSFVYYFSKPYSLEEGTEYNRVQAGIYLYDGQYSTDDYKTYLQISMYYGGPYIYFSSESISTSCFSQFDINGNVITAVGSSESENASYSIKITINDGIATATVDKYDYNRDITLNNYSNMQPVVTYIQLWIKEYGY